MSQIAEGIQQSENEIIFECKSGRATFQHSPGLATNLILLLAFQKKNK